MLPNLLRNQIIQALLNVPRIDNRNRRDELLSNLPPNIVGGLTRNDAARTDLNLVVGQLDKLGRLVETGERPLIIIAQAATPYVEGTEAGRSLIHAIASLEKYYQDPTPGVPRTSLPRKPVNVVETLIPEVIIFGDERVNYAFMERALGTAQSIARLDVPRCFNGKWSLEKAAGTAWLAAPSLLITNAHVIAARFPGDMPSTAEDRTAQAAKTCAWFDYRVEGEPRDEREVASLVCFSTEFDYAVLRLAQPTKRRPLTIARKQPYLAPGDRLNIVQHPGGGPLKYAVRSNHYIGTGGADGEHLLRYLTDTEQGSSGSPVFDDKWAVVALHSGAMAVEVQNHQGKDIFVNNEGIAIHTIMKHMPPDVRAEIEDAQGWNDAALA